MQSLKRMVYLLCALVLCAGREVQAGKAYAGKAVPEVNAWGLHSLQGDENAETGIPFYEDGDVVGFIGDSITHVEYSSINYVEFLYNYYLSRFPDRRVEFRNLGVSSYKVSDILNIYDEDPAFKGINKAVILLGMNEALEKVPAEGYIGNMELLINRLKRSGLDKKDILLLSPTPYDQTCNANFDKNGNPYRLTDDTLTEYTEQLAGKAEEWGVCYIDLHTPLLELTQEIQKESKDNTITIWDCVHPSAMGEMAMAYYILKAQGASETVARVTSVSSEEIGSVHREITDYYRGENGLFWKMKAETLPMAVTYEFQEFSQWFDLVEALNQEILCVEGLEEGVPYTLAIGGSQVGTFTGKELSEGINLAVLEDYPLQARMQEAEALNQQWHDNSAEYRKIVRFATMAKPTHTKEQMKEAYDAWTQRDQELREGMYGIVREAISQPIPVTIIREGYSLEELEREAAEARKQAMIDEQEREKEEKEAKKAAQEAARKELMIKIAIGTATAVAGVLLIVGIALLISRLKRGRRR